jgi:hypothetical protein
MSGDAEGREPESMESVRDRGARAGCWPALPSMALVWPTAERIEDGDPVGSKSDTLPFEPRHDHRIALPPTQFG